MRWPWVRQERREEERLKEELRERARGLAGDQAAAAEGAAEPEAHGWRAGAGASVPVRPAGFAGTDLTLYVRRHGRALGFGGRPRPMAVVSQAREYYGHELTLHVSSQGLGSALRSRRALKVHPARQVLGVVVGAVRWLFRVKPKILIIERYLWAECFGYFLLGSLGFTIFMLITSIFTLGEKIFSKDIPPFTIARVLMLSTPAFLVLAIPVAVVFATLMGMGRLNRDNELVAFATNGISLYRMFIPFISLGLLAGILTWLVYEHVVPPNNQQYKEVLKVFWEAQVVGFIKPGIIIKAPQRKYFYVEEINKTENVMYNLRLYDYYAGEQQPSRSYPRVFLADEARVQDKFLVLYNVKLYELDKEAGDTVVCATMPEIKIDIGTRAREYYLEPHPTEMHALELRNRVSRRRDRLAALKFPSPGMHQSLLRDWTEYYFKYSIPFACLAFVLVAVPVSLRGPRDERNLGIILSFVLIMIYYTVFFSCRTVGGRGLLLAQDLALGGLSLVPKGANLFPPQLAGWLAPGVFLAAAVVLIWRARK